MRAYFHHAKMRPLRCRDVETLAASRSCRASEALRYLLTISAASAYAIDESFRRYERCRHLTRCPAFVSVYGPFVLLMSMPPAISAAADARLTRTRLNRYFRQPIIEACSFARRLRASPPPLIDILPAIIAARAIFPDADMSRRCSPDDALPATGLYLPMRHAA